MTPERRGFLKTLGLGATSLALANTLNPCGSVLADGERPNVLFIAVDDLRPQLGCYGHTQTLSPNINKLAAEGMQFNRAYCQVPVCGASRASLLTGVRPTRKRFVTYHTRADEDLPGGLSLPHHFKANGYETVSLGKIYHHRSDDKEAWTALPAFKRGDWAGRGYLLPENKAVAAQSVGKKGKKGLGPAYEAADVEDNAYPDGRLADKAMDEMKKGFESANSAAKKTQSGIRGIAQGFGRLVKSLGIITLIVGAFAELKNAINRNQEIHGAWDTPMTQEQKDEMLSHVEDDIEEMKKYYFGDDEE